MSLGRNLGSPFRKAAQIGRFHSLQTDKVTLTGSPYKDILSKRAKERSIAKKRKQLINELFETEKTYHRHLSLLTTLFVTPLREQGLLPVKALEGMFANVEAIQTINSQLLDSMEKFGVAQAFQEMAPFMKLYSLYANNYENAMKIVEDQEKKATAFQKFKLQKESLPEMQGLKLSALLITPIQRVPRYKLLLESILEQTSEHNESYNMLQEASREISNLATHINECIRQHENFQKMLEIQNKLTGDAAPRILTPGRLFLREGILLKVCKRGGSKERMIFLFNDILICSKRETSSTFNCRQVLSLADCVMEQVMGGANPAGGSLFKVIPKTSPGLLLYSESQQDAFSWMQDIRSAIGELHSNLASLRRTQQEAEVVFRQREIQVRPGTRLRRSRVIVEKKNANPLVPLKRAICPSPLPCKDSLYPMRKTDLRRHMDQTETSTAVAARCFKSAKRQKSTAYGKENAGFSTATVAEEATECNSAMTEDAARQTSAYTQSIPKSRSCFGSLSSIRCDTSMFDFTGSSGLNLDQANVSRVFATGKGVASPPSSKRQRVCEGGRNEGGSLLTRSIKRARRSRKAKSASEISKREPDFTSWYYNNNNTVDDSVFNSNKPTW